MKVDEIPPQFKMVQRVQVGQNLFIRSPIYFAFEGNVPLLIGDGDAPRVWLSTFVDKPSGRWAPVVRDNYSSHPDIRVSVIGAVTEVMSPTGHILRARKMSEGEVSVAHLDLRPLGINVWADPESLYVMHAKLKGNVFEDVGVAMQLAHGQPRVTVDPSGGTMTDISSGKPVPPQTIY